MESGMIYEENVLTYACMDEENVDFSRKEKNMMKLLSNIILLKV